MKRTERHHLKENDLRALARRTGQLIESRKQQMSWGLAVVVVVGLAAVGYAAWRQSVQANAGALLAEAVTVRDARVGPPPAPGTVTTAVYFPTEQERTAAAVVKFKAAADAYPATDAGVFARYRQAAMLMQLGRFDEAGKTYQQVIDAAGARVYGQMARLGLAGAQVRAGQYDQAILAFKELSQRKDGPLPVDGILIELGRVYLQAGKAADAKQAFTRVVDEFPESPFSADAKRELENLKKT